MKKILIFVFCALLLLGACLLPASAATATVIDEANVLTTAEETALASHAEELSAKTGYDIVILTVSAITETGYDTCDFGVSYAAYRFQKIYGAYTDGVIFLYVGYDPYSNTGAGCYAIATEGVCRMVNDDRVLDPMLSDMQYGNFADAFHTGLDAFSSEMRRATRSPIITRIVVSLAVGIAVGLTVALVCKKRMNTVRKNHNAAGYTVPGSFRLTGQRDIYLYSRVTAVRVQSSNSRGGSSGGGGHHGGGGRRL